MTRLVYPDTRKSNQVDDYHGTRVTDPYRWLEDTDSAETKAWIAAQNEVTFRFLAQIPAREGLRKRLAELWDWPKRWAPVKRGGRYFQLRNSGLQNQDVLYVMDAPHGEGHILLDPNEFSKDGTVALSGWAASPDGRWLAYATSASGSDWMVWRVRDVENGQDMPDRIEWSKFTGAAWQPDGSGFYYARYDAPAPGQDFTGANYFHKLYFHRLGNPQAQDRLVYERPDQKEWLFSAEVSEDGRYLILYVNQGTDVRNGLFYQDLPSGGPVVELVSELEAGYAFVGNDGPQFYLRTDLDAPRGHLIAIDLNQPEKTHWQTLVPEKSDTLEMAKMVHNEFVTVYLHDAHHRLERFDRQGTSLGEIALPGPGSITSKGYQLNLTGRREDSELFFSFWSFLHPITVYRYDFQHGKSEYLFAPPLNFDTRPYLTRQVFVSGKDGAHIPLFLTHRRDLALDGNNPALLYGYGGFNIPLVPVFEASYLAWLEMGGVLAWANLRGGGEYGEEWHQAGMLHNKQNVFDDFIACAEYLISARITSRPKLAILGRSNGGLLVGACLAQRPDLFGAAVPVVGVMDMLRFHKFTIGWAWVSDYGSSEDPEGFRALYAYSPLHNLKPGVRYPPTLVLTSDHDDRVVPGHSFKFAATMQSAQDGDFPVLIRIQREAGHGQGKPTAVLIEETADIWAFLTKALEIG